MARKTTAKTAPADEPAYRQIANYLRERILDGTFPDGSLLPSEQQLADEYGKTRPTVRHAVAVLTAEGLVETTAGRGTFVRSPHKRPDIVRPRGVYRDPSGAYAEVDRSQWTPTEPTEWTRLDAARDLADLLAIPVGEPTYTAELTQTADYGRLRQIHRTHVPFSVILDTPMAETGPPTPPALYAQLEKAGHKLHWTEYVRARMPLPAEAAALKLPAGVPLLNLLRLTLNHDARPLALEETLTPGDTQELTYTFAPQTTPGRRTR
jgi:GntR family transcriptional regulator